VRVAKRAYMAGTFLDPRQADNAAMAYDEELADRIREVLWVEPGLVEKRMFGGLAFLIGGHIAIAATRDGRLMLKVDEDELEAALALPHVAPMVMRDREMVGWVRVDADALEDDAELSTWIDHGMAYARALPPKD
jgi:TfoX/Sxy family transcriptional regulator of competence genes